MSERWSAGSPRTCSGAMYPIVPSMRPACVCGGVVGSALMPDRSRLDLRELGEPEVENLHAAISGDEDVLRLQIAMNDPLLVRRRQTTRDLHRILNRLAHRQRAGGEPLSECLPFEQFRDDVR